MATARTCERSRRQCTQALFSGTLGCLESTGLACQPGYMARGRRNAKREAAQEREIEALKQADRERRELDERDLLDRRLARKWGSARSGLDRLSALSKELERLHRDEAGLLQERDELVSWLRRNGHSWTSLSARTRLSRQALMKRSDVPRGLRE